MTTPAFRSGSRTVRLHRQTGMTALSWGAVMLALPTVLSLGGCEQEQPETPKATAFVASRQVRFGVGTSAFCAALVEIVKERTARLLASQGSPRRVPTDAEMHAALKAYRIAVSAGNSLELLQLPSPPSGDLDRLEIEFALAERVAHVEMLLRALEAAGQQSLPGAPTREEMLTLTRRIRDENAAWLAAYNGLKPAERLDFWLAKFSSDPAAAGAATSSRAP